MPSDHALLVEVRTRTPSSGRTALRWAPTACLRPIKAIGQLRRRAHDFACPVLARRGAALLGVRRTPRACPFTPPQQRFQGGCTAHVLRARASLPRRVPKSSAPFGAGALYIVTTELLSRALTSYTPRLPLAPPRCAPTSVAPPRNRLRRSHATRANHYKSTSHRRRFGRRSLDIL